VLLSLDVAQATGAVDVRAATGEADLVAGCAPKWLLGPVGIGYCFVAPNLQPALVPPVSGAQSLAEDVDPFAPVLRWAPGARRFVESDPSLFDICGFRAAVDLATMVGVREIESRVLARTEALAGALARDGHDLVGPWPRPPARSSGIVAFRTPGVEAGEQVTRLADKGITTGLRGNMVRLAPHGYQTWSELDQAVAALHPPRRSRSRRRARRREMDSCRARVGKVVTSVRGHTTPGAVQQHRWLTPARGPSPVARATLPNGLRIVVLPDHEAPSIVVAVHYDVGFRSEPEGRSGMAHLFEHLMFQGSPNLDKGEATS